MCLFQVPSAPAAPVDGGPVRGREKRENGEELRSPSPAARLPPSPVPIGMRTCRASGRSPGSPSLSAVPLPGLPVVCERHRQAYSSGGCAGLGFVWQRLNRAMGALICAANKSLTGLPVSPLVGLDIGPSGTRNRADFNPVSRPSPSPISAPPSHGKKMANMPTKVLY